MTMTRPYRCFQIPFLKHSLTMTNFIPNRHINHIPLSRAMYPFLLSDQGVSHLQHEIKEFQPVAMSLQVICDVKVQHAERLCLYMRPSLVLRRHYNQGSLYWAT